MTATIVQVNVSPGGLPKRSVESAYVTTLGLRGDAHAHPAIHGGPRKAILLIATEVVDELVAHGCPLFYGALGENLSTRGLDIRSLRIGDRLRAGGALLEITQPRGPCNQLDVYGPGIQAAIYDAAVKARNPASVKWGMSGFYAAVSEEGPVAAGDSIAVLSSLA